MHPRDLLSLARTTRELRKFLLSRRAAALSWRAARERQVPDLPPCPAFLSEPMYASLVFETACQVSLGFYSRGARRWVGEISGVWWGVVGGGSCRWPMCLALRRGERL